MVKAIMHGCNGKMGQVISGLVKEDDVIEIVAGIDKFTGIENPYPVFTSLAECDVQADVVIDFSNAAAVDELLDVCVEKTLPVVLCTTGLSEEQLQEVEEASKSCGSPFCKHVTGSQSFDEAFKGCSKGSCSCRL